MRLRGVSLSLVDDEDEESEAEESEDQEELKYHFSMTDPTLPFGVLGWTERRETGLEYEGDEEEEGEGKESGRETVKTRRKKSSFKIARELIQIRHPPSRPDPRNQSQLPFSPGVPPNIRAQLLQAQVPLLTQPIKWTSPVIRTSHSRRDSSGAPPVS